MRSHGHSNKVRWLLLEEARKIEGNNLIFCIDADEVLSPNLISDYRKSYQLKRDPVYLFL
jgi:hypothetical protein